MHVREMTIPEQVSFLNRAAHVHLGPGGIPKTVHIRCVAHILTRPRQFGLAEMKLAQMKLAQMKAAQMKLAQIKHASLIQSLIQCCLGVLLLDEAANISRTACTL